MALFLDEAPTARYWPDTLYYAARAEDGLHNPDAGRLYGVFLSIRERADTEDALVVDARRDSPFRRAGRGYDNDLLRSESTTGAPMIRRDCRHE